MSDRLGSPLYLGFCFRAVRPGENSTIPGTSNGKTHDHSCLDRLVNGLTAPRNIPRLSRTAVESPTLLSCYQLPRARSQGADLTDQGPHGTLRYEGSA